MVYLIIQLVCMLGSFAHHPYPPPGCQRLSYCIWLGKLYPSQGFTAQGAQVGCTLLTELGTLVRGYHCPVEREHSSNWSTQWILFFTKVLYMLVTALDGTECPCPMPLLPVPSWSQRLTPLLPAWMLRLTWPYPETPIIPI